MRARLAITCGDPAGVGPEIIATWLAAHPAEAKTMAVIGPARWLATLGPVEKVAVGLEDFAATPGQPDPGLMVALTDWPRMTWDRQSAICCMPFQANQSFWKMSRSRKNSQGPANL